MGLRAMLAVGGATLPPAEKLLLEGKGSATDRDNAHGGALGAAAAVEKLMTLDSTLSSSLVSWLSSLSTGWLKLGSL